MVPNNLINTLFRAAGILDGTKLPVPPVVDSLTQALSVVQDVHREVHHGDAYYVDIVNTTMGSGDTIVLAFKTSDSERLAHMLISWSSKVSAHIEFLEAPSWNSSSGSQLSFHNRNRDAPKASALLENTGGSFVATEKLVKDPTSFTGGIVLSRDYIWGDKKSASAVHRDEGEYILKRDTLYAVRLTSDAVSNECYFSMSWYEHSPED